MNKRFALLLILVLTESSLIVVKPAYSSIPKPSVPEFTLEYVDNSYDVPPTYSIDPYTGENVTHPGYHVENFAIEVAIKNQPFPSILDGNAANLYYNIRTKGHFTENWTELYDDYSAYASNPIPVASSSEYTVLSFPANYPPSGQVDFQVQALIGYYTEVWISYPDTIVGGFAKVFEGEKSSWSDTQTVTIPTPTPTPEPFPTTWIVAAIVIIAVVGVALLVYFRKIRKTTGKTEIISEGVM